jgi:hypothetical protein
VVPHARHLTFDVALSEAERLQVDKTNFKDDDLSSKDFDFEEVFTFDKPQRRLTRVVEVTTLPRERDWSNFSFSHYAAASNARMKVNRQQRNGAATYLRNQIRSGGRA